VGQELGCSDYLQNLKTRSLSEYCLSSPRFE